MLPDLLQEERQERLEHHTALQDIKAVLSIASGKNFIKYLFKTMEVTELPPVGLPHDLLLDKLGSLRMGQAIYKLVAEASPDVAGAILAEIEREHNAKISKANANIDG